MKKSFKTATACLLALLIAPVLIFASGDKEKGAKYPPRTMEFIAPAGAGGGWDLTIRTVAKTLQDTKLVSVAMRLASKKKRTSSGTKEQNSKMPSASNDRSVTKILNKLNPNKLHWVSAVAKVGDVDIPVRSGKLCLLYIGPW